MKTNHLAHCLIGITAVVGVSLLFGVQAGTLGLMAMALGCPLIMVFMMRGMMHAGSDHRDNEHSPSSGPTESAQTR